MQRILGVAVAVGWALAIAGPVRADDGKAVVEKAIKALGDEAKVAKFKAATWKFKGTFYGMGEGIPMTGDYAVQWPDQIKVAIEAEFGGNKFNLVSVFNKGKAWRKINDMSSELADDDLEEQKEEMHANNVSTLVPLTGADYTLTTLPEIKVADKPAVGVKVSSKGHRDISLYFDKDTDMLVKLERITKDQQAGGAEKKTDTFYTNYKEVDGVKRPTKISIKRDGELYLEGENSELKGAEKLDDKTFAQP